jgi:hypothetical protein
MTEEMRRFLRVNMLAPLFVKPMLGASAEDCYSRLNEQGFEEYLKRSLYKKMNISGSGIGFESQQPYAPGGVLEIRLMLDDVYNGTIEVCAEVIRVDLRPMGYWVAGRFVNLSEDIRKIILKFVEQRELRLLSRKIVKPGS